LNIREGLGNKMRVENNWVRYLNSLTFEKELILFSVWERSVMEKGTEL
jgi:hypothetical protein